MRTCIQNLFIVLVISMAVQLSHAQGTTAFTYQGQLRDGGTNANGLYTMQFALYDNVSGGTQIGNTITITPTLVNGLFSVNLDFGAGAFNGSARWLDITITNGGTSQELSPRVQVLPTPYALYAAVAATVTNGAIMNAQLASNAVGTTNIQNNAIANQNLTANAVNATNIASGQVLKTLNGLADSVELSAGANVALFTNGNNLQFSAGVPNVQLFGTNGTFTVPTNVARIMVEAWGGGGGGGASGVTQFEGTNYFTPGGGGGAGAYAYNVFNVNPGSNYSVTIGAGGGGAISGDGGGGRPTSFGTLLTANGGNGGTQGTISVINSNIIANPGQGGHGGTASGGLLPTIGGPGQSGSTSDPSLGGEGGSAISGGSGGWGNQSQKDGNGPGGGGGGAFDFGIGGNGAQGVLVVHY